MSFEGYYQIVCENGHQFTKDAYDFGDATEAKCPFCKEDAVWWNLVDVTNGSHEGDERIDGFLQLKIKESVETCTCDKCNNVHVVKEPTYKIPEGKGHKVV